MLGSDSGDKKVLDILTSGYKGRDPDRKQLTVTGMVEKAKGSPVEFNQMDPRVIVQKLLYRVRYRQG